MTHDLRSDFLGPATPEMVAAMTDAALRPQGFGLREDPVQRALEAHAAELLGKDDALLFPTCTMANLVAVMAQTRPGDAVVADAESHSVLSEAGGIGAVAGAQLRVLPGDNGQLPLDALQAQLRAGDDAQRPPISLILLETTHNRSGGVPLPLAHIRAVGELAWRYGAGLHIDGARLFNACAALDLTPAEMVAPATTVAVSLNKGICAPSGAILAGPRAVIERALVLRQRLGGGMRPSGAIAAAGLVALRTMQPQLAIDHANAAALAAALRQRGFTVPACPTNIVLVETGLDETELADFIATLEQYGVLAIGFGPGRIRLCLHRGIAADDLTEIADAFGAARDNHLVQEGD